MIVRGIAGLSGLIVLAVATSTLAQPVIRSKGKIDAIRPGFLKVTAGGGEWVLKVDAKPENISLQATAESDWLRPGMLVRFEANLDEQGTTQTPIEELTVFTPRKGHGLGVLRDDARGGQNQDQKASKRRRRKPKTNKEPTVSGKPSAEEQDGDSSPSRPQFLVAGQVTKRTENQLFIVAGRERITATLDEEVKINVDMEGDYSLAQPGDEIDFTARAVQPTGQRMGQAVARRIKITRVAPLKGPPKRDPATTQRDRRQKNVP